MLNFSNSTVLLYHSINKSSNPEENFHSVSFNNFSYQIIHIKNGYKGLLMSRKMMNIKHDIFNYQKLQIPITERFMPKYINFKKFKYQLLEVKTKKALKKLINIS